MEKSRQKEKRKQMAQPPHSRNRRKPVPGSVRKGQRRSGTIEKRIGTAAAIERVKKKIGGGGSLSIVTWLVCLAFLLSLLPILRMAFYTHPCTDDYSYAAGVHKALESGGNLLDALAAAAKQARTTYFDWQGTFSAIFVFALMPGVFSDGLYFLTTFTLVGALCLCTGFLVETIVVRWLGGRRRHAMLLSALTLFLQIQFLPNRAEGLYWFNGASYYTLFYSLSLALFAMMIRIALSRRKVKKALLIGSMALGIVIGGGNYSTALLTVELSFIMSLLLWIKHNRAWKQTAAVTLLVLALLLVSALAPGNANRYASENPMPPFDAIYHSIQRMGTYIGEWTRLPQIVYMAFLAPFAYFFSAQTKWRFRYPLLVCAIAYLLCASQLTPPYFGVSNQGGWRQVDIYHHSYYLLIAFCEFYFCGWVSRRRLIAANRALALCKRKLIPVCLLLLVLFSVGCYGYGIDHMSSVEAESGLARGEPQQYDANYKEMLELLTSSDGDIRVPRFAVPAYFVESILTDDPEHWINQAIANYFDVKSIAWLPEDDAGA